MSTQKVISGNVFRKKGGLSILHPGNADAVLVTDKISHADNTAGNERYGSTVFVVVSPTSSGNVGTLRAISGGTFGKVNTGDYTAKIIGTKIATTSNTVLQSGASHYKGRRPIHFSESNRRYDITSWDRLTGAATLGANAGDLMSFGNDNAARPTDAVPGELAYLEGPLVPIQDEYKPRFGS